MQIDAGIREIIGSRGPVLMLAGVDYLLPIYADVNKYSDLLEAGITGNPDYLEVGELHETSWPLVAPLFRRAQERASEIYHEELGTGLTSNSLSEILPAARQGRVDRLFTAIGVQVWGTLETDSDRVNVHDEFQPADEDLLDLAASLTFRNSGSVFPVAPEDVPDSSPVAAIFRY